LPRSSFGWRNEVDSSNASNNTWLWLKTPGFSNVTTPGMPVSTTAVTNTTSHTVAIYINVARAAAF
jgi:hypothetical protein